MAGKRGGLKPEINITPLVDVVLVLLIIFMVMTPILLKQLELRIPEKADTDIAPPPPTMAQVVVKIDADEHIYLNEEPITRERLVESVRETMASRREKLVFFDLDDKANYGAVMEVMDACRGAGAQTLGITTH